MSESEGGLETIASEEFAEEQVNEDGNTKLDEAPAMELSHETYDSEVSNYGRNEKNSNQIRKSNNKKQPDTKGKRSNLKRLVSDSGEISKLFGIDKGEFLSYNLARYVFANGNEQQEQGVDTKNGSVAIIYHVDEKTGEMYVLFEQKPHDYSIKDWRGKFQFPGGTIKTLESSLHTLKREIGEEFDSRIAASILINILDSTRDKYTTIYEMVNGNVTYTDIWVAEVKSKNDVEIIKTSRSSHDAGMFRFIPARLIFYLDDSYFVNAQGRVIKAFIEDKLAGHIPMYPAVKPFFYSTINVNN
ncbi:NUDIX hydrolase [Candidatus Woesearchaeota archaeon]|nr:NUDIX hydrolase [Candidatus Woesearchaeota archaeon]